MVGEKSDRRREKTNGRLTSRPDDGVSIGGGLRADPRLNRPRNFRTFLQRGVHFRHYSACQIVKLPNADQAIIDGRKLYGYLLSFAHPTGRFKARFFAQLGYRSDNWSRLADDCKPSTHRTMLGH